MPDLVLNMLSLDSPKWSELRHAYGVASDIPDLLRQLEDLPSSENNKEPWFSIWSSLAHQGDVYSASFAAVPHVVHALAHAPTKVDCSYFQFPAWVEVCRQKNSVLVPQELKETYFAALAQIPSLVAAAADHEWDENDLACALAAIAAAKGYGSMAEAILKMKPTVAEGFITWVSSRQ